MFKDILIDFKAQRCGGSQVGDIVHALYYLKEVKEAISDQREKIHTVPGIIERVKELFKRHPSLLLGFNYFLPKGYEIIPNDEDKASFKKPGDIVQAVSLMYNMKGITNVIRYHECRHLGTGFCLKLTTFMIGRHKCDKLSRMSSLRSWFLPKADDLRDRA
ncbi:hypothetical protein T459_12707 [Capsicum annuum]|uniref:Uncharacterized protein n=1 Tax=Capsicum annuum TaxID=4072 RepID=A0A2G2ZQP1_CAPAN|nr:hypothetical protein T459_12707 [Capsicum annuum]